jgi:hypothetical protein
MLDQLHPGTIVAQENITDPEHKSVRRRLPDRCSLVAASSGLAPFVRALPDTERHWAPSFDFQNLSILTCVPSVR